MPKHLDLHERLYKISLGGSQQTQIFSPIHAPIPLTETHVLSDGLLLLKFIQIVFALAAHILKLE